MHLAVVNLSDMRRRLYPVQLAFELQSGCMPSPTADHLASNPWTDAQSYLTSQHTMTMCHQPLTLHHRPRGCASFQPKTCSDVGLRH